VEKTVQVVSPAGETRVITQEKIVQSSDLIENVLQKNVEGLVAFYAVTESGAHENIGSGFVVSGDGIVATNANVGRMAVGSSVLGNYGGKTFHVSSLSNENSEVSIVKLNEQTVSGTGTESESIFKPLNLASDESVKLGNTVIGIDATKDVQIDSGIVTRLEKENVVAEDGTSVPNVTLIHTDIVMSASVDGGPLILTDGTVAGLVFVSKDGKLVAVPSYIIRGLLDAVQGKGVSAEIKGQTASVLEKKDEVKTVSDTVAP
jgi:hypothetical protein